MQLMNLRVQEFHRSVLHLMIKAPLFYILVIPTDWVEVAGPQGATGSATVGPTGPTGFLPYGNAS